MDAVGVVSVVVIGWTLLNEFTIGQQSIKWPGLHNQIFLTLYNKPYAALYSFQPLGTGTAILLTVGLTSLIYVATGSSPKVIVLALADTWRQLRFAILTVVLIIGLAYLFNYSGMAYTVGLAISKVGAIYPSSRSSWDGLAFPEWQRHLQQCALREPASGSGPSAQPQSSAHGCFQLLRWSNEQNDLTADRDNGRLNELPGWQGRSNCRENL